MIQDEQADGWSTVEKKNGEMGFVPTAFLDKSKQKRKGTLFSGKKKGSSEPPVSTHFFFFFFFFFFTFSFRLLAA